MSRLPAALKDKPWHRDSKTWNDSSLQYCADDILVRTVTLGRNENIFDLLEPVELWLADLYAMNYGNI